MTGQVDILNVAKHHAPSVVYDYLIELQAERDAAVQAAEQARAALRFYAIEGNNDKGRIARAALAGNQP